MTIQTSQILSINEDKMFSHSCKLPCAKGTKGSHLGPKGKKAAISKVFEQQR